MLNHLIRCFKPSAFRCQKCNFGEETDEAGGCRTGQTQSFSSAAAVHSFADIKSEDELNELFPEAIFPVCPEGGDTLEGSMEQLKKGLESGTVLIQFEVRDTQGPTPPAWAPSVAAESLGGLSNRGLRAAGQRSGPQSRGWDHSPSLNSASPSRSGSVR